MTILTTLAALQALHATVSGMTSAPTKVPGSLNTTDLPCVLTWPGPATWVEQAAGMPRQNRTYIVEVFVAPVSLGEGIDQGYQAVLPLLEALGQAYLAEANRTLSGAVDQLYWRGGLSDGGIQVLPFGKVEYHGCVFRVTVVEK